MIVEQQYRLVASVVITHDIEISYRILKDRESHIQFNGNTLGTSVTFTCSITSSSGLLLEAGVVKRSDKVQKHNGRLL